ncbi:hypothetical protein KCU93_g2685, partial [Aureobasidium melanogenum]
MASSIKKADLQGLIEPPSTIADTTKSIAYRSLTNLPLELLLIIVNHCKDGDLGTLRAVCKSLCASLTPTFAQLKFADLRHHLTEESLQDLNSITSHATFGPCVKSIAFSTARLELNWYGPDRSQQGVLAKKIEKWHQTGEHVNMLANSLGHLKQHGRLDVFLGVFDCLADPDGLSGSTIPWIRGHGYAKIFDRVPRVCDGRGTMLAISQAAKRSEYPLRRFSMLVPTHSHAFNEAVQRDKAQIFFADGSTHLKTDLSLKIVMYEFISALPLLTSEIKTGTINHLSLTGILLPLDEWRGRCEFIESAICNLCHFSKNTAWQAIVIKNLTFQYFAADLLLEWLFHQNLEYLELSKIILDDAYGDSQDGNLAANFLNHFKMHCNVKNLKVSSLTWVHKRGSEESRHLKLAEQQIVAEGQRQVQKVFDDLIAQVLAFE